MILADTSAWVEYDRGTGSQVDARMAELISADAMLAVTEPVVMEVLAGARDDRRAVALRRLLLRFPLLAVDAGTDVEAAARVYRRCRAVGVTPPGLLDCLVATVAWRQGASLLVQDRDLVHVAKMLGLILDPASPGR